jgi:two-component system cell cycle sensor histidine kinase/response regulator CckA
VSPIRDDAGKDKIDNEMLNIKKLESIAALAGGLAHDFNNLLTAILGNISFAKMFVSPDDAVYAKLAEAERASIRARDLTNQLLLLAKGGEPIRRAVRIEKLLRSASSFASSGSNVRCRITVPEDLWPVEVDEMQMGLVVNNLVMNSVEAMPTGGVVVIRADNETVGDRSSLQLLPGAYVRITVEDEGAGIPEEDLRRVFDPDFTTKETDSMRSAGFGLAVCHAVVKDHGGLITVRSGGKGTVFTVYLPAVGERSPVDVARTAPELAGRGKVLVMDDEEVIRLVTGNMLKHMGYEVVCVSSGDEAVMLFNQEKERGAPFDVVILDLTVRGGMGGEEAMLKLREIDPQVKAIVSSGYTRDPVMIDYGRYGFRSSLPKPYRIQDLSEKLQRVMGPRQPA